MKPYYECEGITIYCADCRDVLAQIEPSYTSVVTDPPYGVDGGRGGQAREHGKARYELEGWQDTERYIDEVVVPVIDRLRGKVRRMAVTPGNRCMFLYPRPADIGCFWTPASNGFGPWGITTFQPILYYGKDRRAGRAPLPSGRKLTETSTEKGHPCAKPLVPWRWLVEKVAAEDDVVLDPFMGSGTTLRAAKDLGREAIGIEISERYCEIAAKRLEQMVLPLGVSV